MSLSDPRTIFGIHEVTPYNRTTGSFYGTLRVLGGSSISMAGELIKLNGGSNKYPWAVEDGLVTAEISLKVKEYPSFLFELFLGKAPTDVTTPDADGTVSTITNKYGTSTVASTGIASVTAIATTGPANMKFGKYIVKVASATTVNVYCSTNIDFAHGTDEDFDDDVLLVSGPHTVTSAGDTNLTTLGIKITGGAGTIGMTTGDTAYFYVQPPLTKSMSVSIGANSDVFPEFGMLIYPKRLGNGEMLEIEAYRCKGIGLPLGFEEGAFSEAEIKVEAFYDSVVNKVLDVRWTQPNTAI